MEVEILRERATLLHFTFIAFFFVHDHPEWILFVMCCCFRCVTMSPVRGCTKAACFWCVISVTVRCAEVTELRRCAQRNSCNAWIFACSLSYEARCWTHFSILDELLDQFSLSNFMKIWSCLVCTDGCWNAASTIFIETFLLERARRT